MNSSRIQLLQTQLQQTLAPSHLEVTDESHLHKGHPGAAGGGGHFAICIAAPCFKGKKLLECHRMIYTALEGIMGLQIHALRIKILAT